MRRSVPAVVLLACVLLAMGQGAVAREAGSPADVAGPDGGVPDAAPAEAGAAASPASADGGTPDAGPPLSLPTLEGRTLSPEALWALPPEPAEVLWAGHQILVGERPVPVFGTVDTRMEVFFLARVVDDDGFLIVAQQGCASRLDPVAGVRITVPPRVTQRLPVVPFTLAPPAADGWRYAPTWEAGWGEEDLDEDGHPGVTFHAESFFCSGDLYVGSWSINKARLRRDGAERWVGEMRVRTSQRTLDTTSACLKWGASDDPQPMHGTVAYVPVPAGTTCASLLAEDAWPVEAPEPRRR